ncbi:HD domain-containing protein [Candidatus Fermentibacteria bacterium]|nr:HD domain-containing protein [Candidatus Fermentibacteria bacterium]
MTTKRLRRLSQHIASLPALPTLAPEAFQEASDAVDALVRDIRALGSELLLDGASLVTLAKDLRRIGDPSASEMVAGHLAEVFMEAGRPREAAQFLKVGGLACTDQGLFPPAISMFERALAAVADDDPEFEAVAILNNLGNALTELERFEDAHATYGRAARLLDEAPMDAFQKARGEEPEMVRGTVINNAGWALMRQGKQAGRDHDLLMHAIRAFRQVLQGRLRPRTRIIATGNLAEACLLRGEIATAERLLQPLEAECVELRLERLLPEVYRRRAQLSAARGHVESAMSWTRKALQSSLIFTSPRQEIRVIEVCFDLLKELLASEGDRMTGLERSGAQVLGELLDLLESKDTYTGGDHSRRVASLSRRLAAQLDDASGHDERHLKTVELGGLLHDIGKLMIPWSLLNRLRPLQPHEIELLHHHAAAGEALLMDIGLPELARIAGEHHERPDGTGYPRGITALSLDGAVVAVADAYEAMTSPSRRYRLPLRPKSAVAEVLAASGHQFVPLAAQALEAVILRRPQAPRR